jgi:arylsulfatase A-like enzyme
MLLNFGDAHVPLRHNRHYDRNLHSADNEWTSDGVDIWDLVHDGPKAHQEYLETRREVYGATIEYLDRKMIELYERVDRASPHATTLIVTADHGENMGFEMDDYLLNHKSSLNESLLHVPLYVVNPPSDAPDVVEDYTSHLELGDLVVALANDDWTDISRSRVPAEVIGMSPGPSPPGDEREYWDRMLRCTYEGTEKYVWDSMGSAKRYRLDHDRPCWQTCTDEEASVPVWATDLFERDIDGYKRDAVSDAESVAEDVDDQTRSRLEELGYL